MMACTDRHYRYLARLMSRHALLYTEMVTQDAVIYGDRDRLLQFDDFEQPVALQLGGSDPKKLAQCAHIATEYGYREINLNVGCPSDRVQFGRIGACLMKEPEVVAECVAAMRGATPLPVTVKSRIGVDDYDQYDWLHRFVAQQIEAGIDALIVHARKAWLQGLSPRENREVPPLCYETVYQLKRDFPDLELIINGGIHTFAEIQTHLEHVDGVMLGRAAYHNSYLLSEVDQRLFNDPTTPRSRAEILVAFLPYIKEQVEQGVKLSMITRHLLGLFHGVPGGKRLRGELSNAKALSLAVLQDLVDEVVAYSAVSSHS